MRRSMMLATAASWLSRYRTRPLTGRSADGDVDESRSTDPGHRLSDLECRATVVNEVNETVGTIDDLIVTPGGQTPNAVLSVGGFLGIGRKYVVLPSRI